MPYELPNKDELSDAYKALLATLGNKIGPYIQDYGQLIEKGSPLNNQYQQLKSNISQHIPSNADFRNPQAMSEWSQAAALNAPMGLMAKSKIPKLYRGQGDSGTGISAFGNGLYSSTDKSLAKQYGKVAALDSSAYPSNPLVLNSRDDLTDFVLQKSGLNNIREFNKKYSDIGEYIKSLGYDGVHAGNVVVKYPNKDENNLIEMLSNAD